MKRLASGFGLFAEAVAAAMMAAMFLTFILQIAVRYSARLDWLPEVVPFLEPSRFGWTLEFCLMLWVWLVFWGNAFVVRPRDHVVFDILLNHVRAPVRRWFVIVASVAISVALILAVEPTWEKFHILRLKKTATLNALFGDAIRMRGIYSVFILFLVAVALRYAWTAYRAFRYGADAPLLPDDEPRAG
jgi:C4-dicarboxylate transporter DctQ subunit